MNNITTSEEIQPRIYIDNDAVIQTKPITDGRGVLGYTNEVLMTKEIFVECYKRWIMTDAVRLF